MSDCKNCASLLRAIEKQNEKSIRKLAEQRKTISRKQAEIVRLKSLLDGARKKINELSIKK